MATDSNSGPLTFQFNVAAGGGNFAVIRNFNIGVNNGGVWTAQPFSWASIQGEGAYMLQVVAQDAVTGETATQTIPFMLTTLITGAGSIVVVPTPHPLVALAATPPCAVGSSARVTFTRTGGARPAVTPFQPCAGNVSNNFYVGGMHVSSAYTIGYQIQTGGKIVNGSSHGQFQTGTLPATVTFPKQTLIVPAQPQADTADGVLLNGYLNVGGPNVNFQPTATDLFGHVIWFYNSTDKQVLLTRTLEGAHFLALESGVSWDSNSVKIAQLWREFDLTGNIEKETSIGLVQRQFLALGATDLQPCNNVPRPAPVGAACLGSFSHDVILLPNGDYAFLGIMEKIFPPGTQGDTTGLNVDVLGEAIMVVDGNLNPLWYDDLFQHAGGGTQLDINRPATLNDRCGGPLVGPCPPVFLAGTPGVTAAVNDWLHCNALQYRASDGNFVLSSRSQDWVMLIDYNNGAGTGNLLWRMGPDGDFSFNNVNNDSYPWFSHQHEPGFEANGVLTVFDNGNTRVALQGGNSRGMALHVDEMALVVTPVLSQDVGYYSFAFGSAQLLSNGNYHFLAGFIQPTRVNYSVEMFPIVGTTGAAPVFNLEGKSISYRSFRMTDMYSPPTT